MSFYVTLPSNASRDIYRLNKSSDYTTQLLTPLKLDGSWEVGLAGFSYRQNITAVLGKIKIYHIYPTVTSLVHTVTVSCREGDTQLELLEAINQALMVYHTNGTVKFIYKDNHEGSIRSKYGLKSLIFQAPEFYEYHLCGVLREILAPIAKVLHVVNPEGLMINEYFNDQDLLNRNEFFFFYTNFIEDQYVGDSKNKLLDTVALKGNKGEPVSISLNSPHYVGVSMTEIPSINIEIKDSTGENILFDRYSRVIVKLHFRPKQQ